MNRKIVAVAAIAIICMSAAGIGYAVTTYTGTTYTESDVAYQGYSITLTDTSGSAVSTALEFSRPTYTTPTTVDGHMETTVSASTQTSSYYKLKIECPDSNLKVRCSVTLDDTRSWAIIDHITVKVYANDYSSSPTYTFDLNPPSESSTSVTLDGVVVPYYSWDADQSTLMTLNKTDQNYVTFTIAYKAVTLKYETTEDIDFMDLTGMKVYFAASTADPSAPPA